MTPMLGIILAYAFAQAAQPKQVLPTPPPRTPANTAPQGKDTLPVKEPARWFESITPEGHYKAWIDDPNNEWRCAPLVQPGEYPFVLVISCVRNHLVEPEKK